MLWRSSSSSKISATGRWAVSPACNRRCVIGSCRHVVARVLSLPAPLLAFRACGPANIYVDDSFVVVSLFNGSIWNGVSNGCTHESDPARVVSDFVMCHSSAAASANGGAPGDEIRSRCRLRSSPRRYRATVPSSHDVRRCVRWFGARPSAAQPTTGVSYDEIDHSSPFGLRRGLASGSASVNYSCSHSSGMTFLSVS